MGKLFIFLLLAIISQTQAQNVGIGTTQPKANLHIRGLSTIENPDLWLNSSDIFGATRLKISGPGIPGKYWLMQTSLDTDINNPNNYLLFYRVTDSAAGAGIPSLLINKDGYLGIGTIDPAAPLSFPQTLGKKISLYPGNTGDVGIAVFGNELRQYIDDVNGNITFGFDNYTNGFTERMRINGNGNVGIGTSTPTSSLNVKGQVTIDQKNFGGFGGLYIKGDGPGINYPNIAFGIRNAFDIDNVAAMIQGDLVNNDFGNETIDLNFLTSTAGQGGLSSKMLIKGDGMVRIAGQQSAGTGNKSLSIGGFGDIDVDKPNIVGGRFKILENGNVGIGNGTPNGELQFGNTPVNRKLVLWETTNNNHQFYGLGINGGSLRYQVDNTTSAHKFYAGTSATTSNELLSINGNGSISVNGSTGNPGQVLMSNGSNGSATWTSAANVIKTGKTENSSNIYIPSASVSIIEFAEDQLTFNLTVPSRIIFYYKIRTSPFCNNPFGDLIRWRFETHLNGNYATSYYINGSSRSTVPPSTATEDVFDITNGPDYFDLQPGTHNFNFYAQSRLPAITLSLWLSLLVSYTIIPL